MEPLSRLGGFVFIARTTMSRISRTTDSRSAWPLITLRTALGVLDLDHHFIRVSGSVKGSLHASRLLELLGEAKVEGDLITPPGGLSMESGGSFEGQFVTNAALVSKDNESVSE